MAVLGIGVDAVEINRVERALRRTPALSVRLWTERERATCMARLGQARYGSLAARFAAKEAVAKAFGTGVCGFSFRDVEVLNDELGRPLVELHEGAAALAVQRGVATVHVSLSTSTTLAIAQVVLES